MRSNFETKVLVAFVAAALVVAVLAATTWKVSQDTGEAQSKGNLKGSTRIDFHRSVTRHR